MTAPLLQQKQDRVFRLDFAHCKMLVWPNQQCLVTIFEDGKELPAAPNFDDESRDRAVSLGYGTDLWQMTFDHELMHTLLAEMDGLPYSPALWAAAHPELERTDSMKEDFHREECRVLEMQRMVRTYLTYTGPHIPLVPKQNR